MERMIHVIRDDRIFTIEKGPFRPSFSNKKFKYRVIVPLRENVGGKLVSAGIAKEYFNTIKDARDFISHVPTTADA